MEFKVGRLYISKDKDVIVKCTNPAGCNGVSFEGVVVNDNGSYSRGTSSDEWSKPYFIEYHESKETVITLQNGHKYNIPKGCKATITDDVIEIEEDVVYKKCLFRLSVAYVRLSNTPTIVVIDNSGSYTVKNAPITYTNDTPVEDITKEEFETAYNKAMEVLKL